MFCFSSTIYMNVDNKGVWAGEMMEEVRDWFARQHLELDAWRLVEDDEAGNRYTPFTDTPVVTSTAPLQARIHEVAHSAVAWNATSPPSDAFRRRMQELEVANQWLAETAETHGVDAFADPAPVLTENEALSAAFTEERQDWLVAQFSSYAAGEYTDGELHGKVSAEVLDEADALRDSLSPVYDRMQELAPVVEDPVSEAVPMFASMYETGLLEQEDSHRETFYKELARSGEYDAEALVPRLQEMREDYVELQEEIGSDAAATAVMAGNTDATDDLPYVLTTTQDAAGGGS